MNMTSPSPSHWPVHSIFEHDLNYFQKQTKINIDINCNPALPSLPSHNKREQYSVLRQPNNQIPQCALALKKKKKLPWRQIAPFPLGLFISPPFSPFSRYDSTFIFLSPSYCYSVLLSLLLYIQFVFLFSPTWPLASHGPRSSQYEHPPLQSTNRVILCFPVEFFATNPLIRNDWYRKTDDKTIKMASHSLIPLVILLVVVAIFAVVGYIAYSIVQDVTKSTREKMEERNVMFTKDGMTVGVKELKDEDYKDRSQRLVSSFFPFFFGREKGGKRKKDKGLRLFSVLVNMWNHTSFPAYKSRLWNMTGSTDDQDGAEKRKPWVFCSF